MDKNRFDKIKNKFPDYLPIELLEKEIENLREEKIKVYRICKYGNKNDSFISTYEENEKFKRKPKSEKSYEELDYYSMSCFIKLSEIKKMQKTIPFFKNKPIAEGVTNTEYGIIRINYETTHVDYLLYKDKNPIGDFELLAEE